MNITLDAGYFATLIAIIMTALTGYGVLLGVVWYSINKRLQTLGHEDRDIRGQLIGVLNTVEAHHLSALKTMTQSNALMANVYSQKCTCAPHVHNDNN